MSIDEQPKRIQRKRTKGWRMPENTVCVGRPSKWGNPFRSDDAAYAVKAYRYLMTAGKRKHFGWVATSRKFVTEEDLPCEVEIGFTYSHGENNGKGKPFLFKRLSAFPKPLMLVKMPSFFLQYDIGELRGKDLACWCRLDCACHADVLLELANKEATL